jgi:hypothetical protein
LVTKHNFLLLLKLVSGYFWLLMAGLSFVGLNSAFRLMLTGGLSNSGLFMPQTDRSFLDISQN